MREDGGLLLQLLEVDMIVNEAEAAATQPGAGPMPWDTWDAEVAEEWGGR